MYLLINRKGGKTSKNFNQNYYIYYITNVIISSVKLFPRIDFVTVLMANCTRLLIPK